CSSDNSIPGKREAAKIITGIPPGQHKSDLVEPLDQFDPIYLRYQRSTTYEHTRKKLMGTSKIYRVAP
ncbi:MAG TPA: hypothetical protein VK832_21570, partial [Burkholderiaceae bacterium]|nr:hypothetical protein [Burkholderiaceae bacterium]